MLRTRWLVGLGLLLTCACGDQTDAAERDPCLVDADCVGATVCLEPACVQFEDRRPIRDLWREELVLPADSLSRLVIGGAAFEDNFANRGDIEVRYVPGSDQIVVEIQRFTVNQGPHDAMQAFGRMHLWAYSLDEPALPSASIDALGCAVSGAELCQVRNYYDGQLQPVRDGVNFRVSLPVGWAGALELATEDNLEEEEYPDRGDVRVDGLAGSLAVALDSGRVEVRLADEFDPVAGAGIEIAARVGEPASITVDLAPSPAYTARLVGAADSAASGCTIEVDCAGFETCFGVESPETGELEVALNHPGPPGTSDVGVQVELRTSECATIDHADEPLDVLGGPKSERRGDLHLCTGCLGELDQPAG